MIQWINNTMFRSFFGPTLMLVIVSAAWSPDLFAQAGLRESLERLDRDGDGEIEPEEVTPLARPYLEKILRASRMSIDRDNDIEEVQEAARRYHAEQNGSMDRRVRPSGESTVKEFGPDDDSVLVPEFGLPEVRYPYTQDDLDFADRTIRSHDRNRDGFIDRNEARYERWTHRNPFDDDLNKDDRLSRMEMAQRYARRRLLDDTSDELRRKAWRTGGEVERFRRDDSDRRESSQWWRSGGSSYWLTASIIGRFDTNKNGRLEVQETKELGFPVGQIDVNRDGELTREELHGYLAELQEEAGQTSEGIPGWFYELDENRDGQVAMGEFTTEWTAAKMNEFAALDLNDDGLLTGPEVARSKSMMGGSFTNRKAEVLPPGKTVISEIEVPDDFIIGDLNVQISITHTNVSYLDAYLTGPDGQRIELFTEVGGRDDNFEGTIFDDQSQLPIVKARPPFKGSFLPEAAVKRQPSLSHFNGKNIAGIWQLVIRCTRSDRFGMLHSWSLLARAEDQMLDPPATASTDGSAPASSAGAPPPQRSEPSVVSRSKPEYVKSPAARPSIDYQEINRKMRAAVAEGKMTEEQVREAWAKIKSKSSGNEGKSKDPSSWKTSRGERGDASRGGGREEAIRRYREMQEQRRRDSGG